MARYVLGDVHGNFRALQQVLDQAPLEPGDTLICIGDYVDGWPESFEVVDKLLELEGQGIDVLQLLGNHDEWCLDWFTKGFTPNIWTSQGGRATIHSYSKHGIPDAHVDFLRHAQLYYLTDDDRLFVHAGINPSIPLESQSQQDLLWRRNLWRNALRAHYAEKNGEDPWDLTDFEEVYLGHTATVGTYKLGKGPVRGGEVWNVDQGAGWQGYLTLMDVDTKDFWQSENAAELYPDHHGRR